MGALEGPRKSLDACAFSRGGPAAKAGANSTPESRHIFNRMGSPWFPHADPGGPEARTRSPVPGTRRTLSSTTSSAQQVHHQDHQAHNQEQVDQSSADMQAEPQEPQNQKNNHDSPKHLTLQFAPANPNLLIPSACKLDARGTAPRSA